MRIVHFETGGVPGIAADEGSGWHGLKAAVDLGALGSLAEGLLVEAHESDLSVASEVTQARVAEALKVGAETYEGELELGFLSRLSPIGQR